MADEPFDKDTLRAIAEVQRQELQVRASEVQVWETDLDNQKEIAFHATNAYAKDREQERQAFKTESTKQKFFVGALVLVFVIFAGFLVMQEHIELLKDLLTLGIGFVGGFGYSHYLMRKRNSD